MEKKQLLHIRHITDKIYHYQDITKQPYTQMIKDNYCGYTPKIKESKEQVPQGALATFVPVLLGGNPPGKRRRGRRRRNRDGRGTGKHLVNPLI